MAQLETARGVRDINPSEEMLREDITDNFKKIFSRYGFIPLNTPIIERYDVLSAKFAAGEESDAMSETYTLKDNGGRELGLRFDLTVPLSRYIGMNRTTKMPFKRYQIGKVYRDAPIKEGRYREFTQCDVDIVGSNDMLADATCINVAIDAYKSVGVDVQIQINNRKFFIDLMLSQGVDEDKAASLMMSIDKLDKLGQDGVVKDALSKGFNEDVVLKVLNLLNARGSNDEKIMLFENILPGNQGLEELKELISYFPNSNVVFTPTLARGLGYYTGTVFEVYAIENKNIGAIGAGGRYDKLIGSYLSGGSDQNSDSSSQGMNARSFPAVGISFGLDRIVDVLKKLNKANEKKSRTTLFIVPLGTKKESLEIANKFRDAGINVDLDLMNRGPSKNVQYADSMGIPFVAVIGENELAENVISLKELATRNEEKLSVDEAIKKLLN